MRADMTTAIASDLESPPRWTRHLAVLAGLAALSITLSLVVWFHSTLGYAHGGFLDGADLRGDLIQLLWWSVLAFAAASSAMIAVLPPRVGATLRYTLAYGAGAGAVGLALPILDRFY
jgi:hypothetical protein